VSLTLHVDAARWRTHLEAVARVTPGLVPVAKGNGYGFGNARLAGEAARLRVDTLAVGTPSEVADVAGPFAGRLLVLSPWDGSPDEADEVAGGRVVRTVANADVLAGLAGPAVHQPTPARWSSCSRRCDVTAWDRTAWVSPATPGSRTSRCTCPYTARTGSIPWGKRRDGSTGWPT